MASFQLNSQNCHFKYDRNVQISVALKELNTSDDRNTVFRTHPLRCKAQKWQREWKLSYAFLFLPLIIEREHTKYYGLNVCAPKSLYVEALIISVLFFGGGVSER